VIGTRSRALCACSLLTLRSLLPVAAHAQPSPDPQYQTRQSHCRHDPPPGTLLQARRSDSGIVTHGYTAERVVTLSADAGALRGGDIVVCTEYGRVEIADSEDDQVRLQVRMEGFGEGSPRPGDAAKRVIEETTLHTHLAQADGRLKVSVWHSVLGFTAPGGQPAWVSVRLHVPPRGEYRVTTQAFHGTVAVRRLTLAGATLRGNIGDKLKGIPGFFGATELDNVELAGDVDIDNLAGLPGIRPPVAAEVSGLAAPILVKASVRSTSRMTAVTGGNINMAFQPAPDLGVQAVGETSTGRVEIRLDDGVAGDSLGNAAFGIRRSFSTAGFEAKPVKIMVRASSGSGSINIASMPAARLAGTTGR
jgi:hypothetical protein